MTFNEKANRERNKITRAFAIVAFIIGSFVIPILYTFFGMGDSIFGYIYPFFGTIIGYYAGRRAFQDWIEEKDKVEKDDK